MPSGPSFPRGRLAATVAGVIALSFPFGDASASSGPALTITTPSPTSVVSGDVQVRAHSSDPAGVRRVDFFVDGELRTRDRRRPYTLGGRRGWRTGNELDGVHRLEARAYNRSGQMTTRQISVEVDNAALRRPPSVAVTTPSNGAALKGNVPLIVDASSPVGVRRVEFRVDGELRWTERRAPYAFNGDGRSWDTTTEDDGTHALTIVAFDRNGRSNSIDLGVTIENAESGSGEPVPVPVPADAPEPVPADAPEPVPADAPEPVPADAPEPVPADAPEPVPADAPEPVPADAPEPVPADAPEPVPADAPAPVPADEPVPMPAGAPEPVPASGEADLHVAVSGSDANPCSETAPCRTFSRAYRAANPGDVVEVGGGTYGSDRIDVDASKSSWEQVLFRPAHGANVDSGSLTIYGRSLELREMRIGQVMIRSRARNITLRDIDTSGQSIIESASDIRIIGGDFGPTVNSDGLQIKRKSGHPNPDNILVDGVRFHDIQDNGVGHIDCIQVGGATNITIRNSTFERCGVRDVIFGSFSGGFFGKALIENNWFGPTVRSSISVQAEEAVDLTFRYNSIGSDGIAVGTNPDGGARGNTLVGNVGPLSRGTNGEPLCSTRGAEYHHNVWTNAKCSESDTTASSGFVDQEGFDYRLTANAAANDHGRPGDAPATDLFGTPRSPSHPDAGAHER